MSDTTIDAKIQQLREINGQNLELLNQRRRLVVELVQVRDTINELIGLEEKSESIDVLELSARTANCLKADGICYLAHLCSHSEQELLRMPNLGKISCREIKDALTTRGLSLK